MRVYHHKGFFVKVDISIVKREVNFMSVEIFTTVISQVVVFWVVTPYSLIDIYQNFIGTCTLHPQD
jgi:hypothetical protein